MKINILREAGEGITGVCFIALAIFTPFLRYWRRWGASNSEVTRSLPGDDIVPHPKGGYTQAITIRVPRNWVWLWVIQLGQERGGFYSYDFLENLVGCGIHTVNRIVPEYQHTEESEGLRLHPKMPPMPLVSIETGKMLLFGGNINADSATTWLFYLEEENGNTRLISRWLYNHKDSFGNTLSYYLYGRIAWVMGRKMLLGIKKWAEADSGTNI